MHPALLLGILGAGLAGPVAAQCDDLPPPNITLEHAFPQLSSIDAYAPSNVYLGGQNFSWCCLVAFRDAFTVQDGRILLTNNANASINASSFEDLYCALRRTQFPCGANYDGDAHGAPVVAMSFQHLAETCPGWEKSSKDNLNAWLSSLSGFLLPAVIFCLSVPRRRKLYIFRSFFVAELGGIKSYVPAILGAIGAGIIVALDTIGWLATCFAFAAPMIVSGLYEAMLDNRVLEFLREKIQNKRLTLDMRCRCLMIILIGNLDLALDDDLDGVERHDLQPLGPDESLEIGQIRSKVEVDEIELQPSAGHAVSYAAYGGSSLGITRTVPSETRQRRSSSVGEEAIRRGFVEQHLRPVSANSPQPETTVSQTSTRPPRRTTMSMTASPWRHMEKLLYSLRLFGDDNVSRLESPRQWSRHRCEEGENCDAATHNERPLPRTEEMDLDILRTKTRLRSMLQCQYSFGSIVGAPVIFFLGGFVFALLQSLSNLGDEDISEALAFGSWYMIIPHIAIVSGLLLAGNNPNILEGVFATERDEEPDSRYILGLRFELVYPSCYKTAWQWHRGPTKKRWINQLISTYRERIDVDFTGNRDIDDDMEDLRAKTSLSPVDWFLILSLTILLLGVPYVLAFLNAFYTPQIGLSCRSLTFTIYISMQCAQLLLWLWAYAGPPPALDDSSHRPDARHPLNFFRRGGWLDRSGFYRPADLHWLVGRRKHRRSVLAVLRSREIWSLRALWCLVYQALVALFGVCAVFSSLGGTLMQIIGVYRTAMCYVNTPEWLKPYAERPMVILSTNSAEMIENATRYWRPCAIAAITFMAAVSFIGWWYQRRMRDLFGQLVKKVDNEKYDSPEARISRLSYRRYVAKGN